MFNELETKRCHCATVGVRPGRSGFRGFSGGRGFAIERGNDAEMALGSASGRLVGGLGVNIMRNAIIVGALALVAGAALPAQAADLPSRTVPPAIAPVALPPSWTGFYAGVHLGAVFSDRDSRLDFLATECSVCGIGRTAAGSFDAGGASNTSFLGGVQAGYNLQYGQWLFGVEGDFSLTGDEKNRAVYIPSTSLQAAGLAAITDPTSDGFNGQFKSSLDWISTLRARVGVTSGPLLFYATGGVAFGQVNVEGTFTSLQGGTPNFLTPVSFKNDDVQVGWTIGAGVEAMLSDRWSAKVEYNYADLGKTSTQLGYHINVPTAVRQSVSLEEDLTLHMVKFGLNYRFAP